MTQEHLKPILNMILDDLDFSIPQERNCQENEVPLFSKSGVADLKLSVLHRADDKWTFTSPTNETLNRVQQTETSLTNTALPANDGGTRADLGHRPGAYRVTPHSSGDATENDNSERTMAEIEEIHNQSLAAAGTFNTDNPLIAFTVDEEEEQRMLELSTKELIEKKTLEAQSAMFKWRKAGIIAALIASFTAVGVVLRRTGSDQSLDLSAEITDPASVVEFVNGISLSNFSFSYPISTSLRPTAEEKALEWFIVNNEMSTSNKVTQRFAFLVLAYAWNVTIWNIEKGFDECSFSGVICNKGGSATTLNLADIGLIGTIPNDIGLLSSLNSIVLEENSLTGPVPWDIILSNLPDLKYLVFRDNQLSGPLPNPSIGHNLEMLILDGNRFEGTISPNLGFLSSLRNISVPRNRILGTIPTNLGNLTNLEGFGMDGNYLHGSIPTELGHWSGLKYFSIVYNAFSGTIPTEVALWTNINLVTLNDNSLNGTLPAELERWTKITYFTVANNDITGALPAWIGNWSLLQIFRIQNNCFTGQLPDQIAHLSNIQVFNVSYNTFTGEIPMGLSHWGRVSNASMEGNNLTGSLQELCNATSPESIIVSDCAEVTCPCCDLCF